jgi:hypothetical protein
VVTFDLYNVSYGDVPGDQTEDYLTVDTNIHCYNSLVLDNAVSLDLPKKI